MSFKTPLRTAVGLTLAGLAVTALSGAASADTIVVNGSGVVTRTVPVEIGDLNLTTTEGRAELGTRIDIAARNACHIMLGSALNKSQGAMTCLDEARAGAWAQVDTRSAMADGAVGRVASR